MPKTAKIKLCGPETRDEFEEAVARYAQLTIELDEKTATMEGEIAEVREGYRRELDALQQETDLARAQAKMWGDANKTAFGKDLDQAIDLVHATVRYRRYPPSIQPLPGKTWDKDITPNLPEDYARVVREPDKARMLADFHRIGAEGLKELGVRRVQKSPQFQIEVKRESFGDSAAA